MLRYTEVCLSGLEVPGEVSICIYISGCCQRCFNCHYPLLQSMDYGEKLADYYNDIIAIYRSQAMCVWAMKAIMFGASYDHIINEDEDLREFINVSRNAYDLHNFRRYNDFEYKFDTSLCWGHPSFYRSVLRIYDKNSGEEVWKMGICLKEGEL